MHVIADLTTGGAEMMMKRLIEAHEDSSQFHHHVISLRCLGRVGPELEAMGVPVEALGMRGAIEIPRVVWQIAKRLRKIQPDVLHAWMYHANLLGGLAARVAGVRALIWGIRATSFDATMGVSRSTTLLRRLSALASRLLPSVIVYVAYAARAAHEKIGYATTKGVIIPNGYQEAKSYQKEESRLSLGIPQDAVVIGSVGRFNEAKNPLGFVEAASLVAMHHPTAVFMMIGRQVTPDNRALTRWIDERGLTAKFCLLGEQNDLGDYYAAMDIFCLHSVTEAFPNVVAEAMSAGLPCVVTDVGDAAFLLDQGGIVVPLQSPTAMARAINELIKVGPRARERIGAMGRERINTNYSIASVVRRYEDLYRELVENPRVLTVRN